MLWFIYFVPKISNTRKNVAKSDATLGENTEDSNNDFKMIMDRKFEEFKTYIISKLTESVKHIIQTEIHGILKGCKDQLENVTSIVSSCHVTYAFQGHFTLYSCLNIKELLAWSRREIWSLSDCNWTQTQDH